ncbi:PrsW family intramembrane metalloprotease [Candidatus Gottesmanbacteria bacterium]|nr:PrsW family intramembrane metalloprotease [Candidatus Gottesmanbacteria bacterium]
MEEKNDSLPVIFFVSLAALVLPLVLIPVEKFVPYPCVIEELAKAALILIILRLGNFNIRLEITLLATLLFSLSENIFYLPNFMIDGMLYSFWQRLILTTILHVSTGLIILLPCQKNRRLIFPATLAAMLVHFLYNYLILLFLGK